jgi:hypothetical protein
MTVQPAPPLPQLHPSSFPPSNGPSPRQRRNEPQPTLRRRGEVVLGTAALVVAIAACVVSGITLARQGEETSVPLTVSPLAPTTPLPNPSYVAGDKKAACDAWAAASSAMISARKPFLESPLDWQNPVTVSTFVQAQAGVLAQVEYLRQHTPATTPADVAGPIGDFIAANVDLIALDGQYKSAVVVNEAADRGNAAAKKIRIACGIG